MLQKIKAGFMNFMQGRYGSDKLGMTLVWGGLALYLVGAFTGIGLIQIISLAAYVFAIFRMFSRNRVKREDENRRFMALTSRARTKFTQARARFRNRKEYKYFRCPKCKTWLRLTRKDGKTVVTVSCGKCHADIAKRI